MRKSELPAPVVSAQGLARCERNPGEPEQLSLQLQKSKRLSVLHTGRFLLVWERAVGSHHGCVQGFPVRVTEPSVELVFWIVLFCFSLWLCSLESWPCVLFSIQKVISMSETL